jgi:hypothetical protein
VQVGSLVVHGAMLNEVHQNFGSVSIYFSSHIFQIF